MFNPDSSPIMPVKVGDRVKFTAISEQEFITLGGILMADDLTALDELK
jgi:allophanate hydrolase subunit 1